MLELIFLIFLAFDLYIASVPTNVLNTKEWYLIFSPYEIYLSFARLFGSIPVGVLGIVFAKRTGRLRIPTIIASVINILASAAIGDAFTYEYRQTNMLHDGQTCKVLDFKEEWAKVYYYCEHGGDVITFVLDDNKWIMEEWNTVWSNSGSADGIQWPYIWHNFL